MKAKAVLAAAMAALAVAGWQSVAGFEISEELRLEIQRDVETLEKEGPRMGDLMAALREAGASFLPELVASTDVDRYQTMARRRLAYGVHAMDLTYATTFGRRAESAQCGAAVYELLEILGYPNPDMERRYREALENIDDPEGDERLSALLKEHDRNAAWQSMLESGAGVELVADGLYGFLLEGLYLTGELCALSNYDPSYMMYVAYLRDSFEAYKRLLHRLGDIPELADSVERHDRLNFLVSILAIMGELPEVGPTQLESLRPSIAKARGEIIR